MSSYNRVVIMGNLTREPELRETKSGIAVTDLGVALNRVWTGDDGQRQEETTFVDVTVWGRMAENASKYLQKGRAVLVEGRLQTESWQDRDSGKNRSRLKVVADQVQYLGGNPGGGGEVGAERRRDEEQGAGRAGEGEPRASSKERRAPQERGTRRAREQVNGRGFAEDEWREEGGMQRSAKAW